MPLPGACWPPPSGRRVPEPRVRPPRSASGPRPGQGPRSAGAAGRWSGRAGRPFCGWCAVQGTSSSNPRTCRLVGAERQEEYQKKLYNYFSLFNASA